MTENITVQRVGDTLERVCDSTRAVTLCNGGVRCYSYVDMHWNVCVTVVKITQATVNSRTVTLYNGMSQYGVRYDCDSF